MNRKLPYATGRRARRKGITFRSSLEVCWCEVLDSAGISWMYEAKRFNFNGDLYLPDFCLPGIIAWLEVKPAPPTPAENYLLCQLAVYARQLVYCGVGKPWEGNLLRYESVGGDVEVAEYPVLALLTGMEVGDA